ncbi:hypothetical protein K469DRAFT_72650 [Zopfia rhizophila CBS 207.26]|uniref:Uncharacterized protein n=1 Tax=Zopfia rhizophila CBS 207.26 TaxID=1314779 RepID=A0A6A6EFI4_9PEZI|nr:hypothetical protein K469DRAFT_72650 [Zopfia rhizophila CBS 207.26]
MGSSACRISSRTAPLIFLLRQNRAHQRPHWHSPRPPLRNHGNKVLSLGKKILMPYKQVHFNPDALSSNTSDFDPGRFLKTRIWCGVRVIGLLVGQLRIIREGFWREGMFICLWGRF